MRHHGRSAVLLGVHRGRGGRAAQLSRTHARRPAAALDPWAVAPALAAFKGHRMAKAALETAVLDAWLRAHDLSMGQWLGATAERV